MTDYLEKDAVVSGCLRYRYLLRRIWDYELPRLLVVMLNPSIADGKIDDPTIKQLVRLSAAVNFGGFEVVNLFAFRATDPQQLYEVDDPIGLNNDTMIKLALMRCDMVACGWGAHKMAVKRGRKVWELLREQRPAIFCFDKTKAGAPKHPLYIKAGTQLRRYAA